LKENTHDSSHNGHAQHQEEETSVDRVNQPLQFMQERLKLSLRKGKIELEKCNK
jgi:hypothetical protein